MRKIALLSCCLLMSLMTHAIIINHGPYICDLDSNAVTIMWTTDKPGLAWVEIAEMADDHFYSKEREKYFETRHGRKFVCDSVHSVRIEGLKADTKYRYRIFTREMEKWNWSDWVNYGDVAASKVYKKEAYTFKTFPTKKRDVSFLVLNDIHEKDSFMYELCKDIDFEKLDFVALNGDMTNRIEDYNNTFDAYVDTCVTMFATHTPIFLNRGNHETRGKYADYLDKFFPTPTGKFYQLKKICGVNYLFIDSGEDKPDSDIEYGNLGEYDAYRQEQTRWLQQLQRYGMTNDGPTIVFCHIPPTFNNWHGSLHLQETIIPELNKMNVSLMFSGHIHRFAYQEPNDVINFPNIVNSNVQYMLCHVTETEIIIDCAGEKGSDKQHFVFPLR